GERFWPDPKIAHNVFAFLSVFLGVDATGSLNLRFNIFTGKAEGKIPGREWTALHDREYHRLHGAASNPPHRFKPEFNFFRDQVIVYASAREYEPRVEYLRSLTWDSADRGNWLSQCWGVPDDPYHRAVGRNVIGGMIKRAYAPGCKHDETMVLMSPQGRGKQ